MLLVDAGPQLAHPLPDARLEALPPEVVAAEPFLLELALHHVLRGDAGVVLARQPERRLALHPVPAHERVRERILEPVAEVQLARHVRRGHHDAVGRLARHDARAEVLAFLPEGVDAVFHRARLVGGGEPRAGWRVGHCDSLTDTGTPPPGGAC